MSIIPKLVALGLVGALSSPFQQRQTAYDPMTPDSLSIHQLWLVTYLNEAGQEVLVVGQLPNGDNFPLIAADQARMESMMPTARDLAKANNVKMRLVKFKRVDMQDIVP
jgi:hypothetical protein